MARGFRVMSPQFGKETTYGTPVASDKVLTGAVLDLGLDTKSELLDVPGLVVPAGVEVREIMTAGEMGGKASLNWLPYIFASVIDKSVASTLATGGVTLAREWKWTLNPAGGGQVGQSYTIRYGDGTTGRDYMIPGAVFTGFRCGFARSGLEFAAQLIGRKWQSAQSKTAAPTKVKNTLMQPKAWDVWADDSWASIGGTQLLALYSGGVKVEGRWMPDWPVNSSLDSFNGIIPGESPGYADQMTVGVDAAADALIDTFEKGAVKFFRTKYVGATIDGTAKYSLQFDFPALITGVGRIQSLNGVAVIPLDYTIATDDVAANSLEVTLICETSAL